MGDPQQRPHEHRQQGPAPPQAPPVSASSVQHVVLFEDDVVHWMLDFLRRRGLLQSMRALEREANVCTLAGITQEGLYLRSLVLDGKWSTLHRALDVLLPPATPPDSRSGGDATTADARGNGASPYSADPETARRLRFLVKRQEYIELLAFDPAADHELPEAIKGKVLAIQQQQQQQPSKGPGIGGAPANGAATGVSHMMLLMQQQQRQQQQQQQQGGVSPVPVDGDMGGVSGGGGGGGGVTEGHLVISKALLTAVLALLAELKQLCSDPSEFAALCQLLTHEQLTDLPSFRTWTRAATRLELYEHIHTALAPLLGSSSNGGGDGGGGGGGEREQEQGRREPPPSLFPPDYLETLLGLGLIRLKRELGGVSDAYVEVRRRQGDVGLGGGGGGGREAREEVREAVVRGGRRRAGGAAEHVEREHGDGSRQRADEKEEERGREKGTTTRGVMRTKGGVKDGEQEKRAREYGRQGETRQRDQQHARRGGGERRYVAVAAADDDDDGDDDDDERGVKATDAPARHTQQPRQQQQQRQQQEPVPLAAAGAAAEEEAEAGARTGTGPGTHRPGAARGLNGVHVADLLPFAQQQQPWQEGGQERGVRGQHQRQQQHDEEQVQGDRHMPPPPRRQHKQWERRPMQEQQRHHDMGEEDVDGAHGWRDEAVERQAALQQQDQQQQQQRELSEQRTPPHPLAHPAHRQLGSGSSGGGGGDEELGRLEERGLFVSREEQEAAADQSPAPMTSTPRRRHRHHKDHRQAQAVAVAEDGSSPIHTVPGVTARPSTGQAMAFGGRDGGGDRRDGRDEGKGVAEAGTGAQASWEEDASMGLLRREPCPPRFQRQLVGVVEDQLAVRSLAFHPTLPYVAVGANSQTLRVCSTHSFQHNPPMGDGSVPALPVMLQLKRHHRGSIYSLAWSDDGAMLASGSNDKTAHVMRFDDQRCSLDRHWDIRPHDGTVRDLVFSSREPLLLSGGAGDCCVAGHDYEQCRTVFKYKGHTDQVSSVSSRGDLVLSASLDATVRLWDMRQDMCIRTVSTKGIPATGAAINPDATIFTVGLETGVSILFDLRTGKELQQWVPHQSDCRSVQFSTDGQAVLTGSYDGTARLSAMGDHPQYTPFTSGIVAKHNDKIIQARWHPGLPIIGTTSADHTARFWYLWL